MGVLNHKTILAGVLAPMVLLPLSLCGQDTDLAQPAVEQAPVNVVPPKRTLLPGEAGSTVDKRAFGVLPNYRPADGSLPFSPLTTNQKFTIAFKDTVDGLKPSILLCSIRIPVIFARFMAP
jgi:hypothetical protein